MKRYRHSIWGICICVFLITTLLLISIPWHRAIASTLIWGLGSQSEQVSRASAFFLGNIKGDPKMIVPALLRCLKDQRASVREMTAASLGHIRQDPEQVVPALLATIDTETNGSLVPIYALNAIGVFGADAKPWSPILVQMVESNRFGYWSGSALNALHKIDPEADARLVQKRESMHNTPSAK